MSPAPHRPTADPQEIIADLQRELAVCRAELDQRTAELSDALEQQTAAAEVLGVINSSPGDLAPVFDSMLDKALRLCGADFGNLLRYDGKLFHVASAVHGNREIGERNRGRAPFPPPPGGLLHPILQGEDVVYVEDLLHDPAYHSVAEIREMVDRGGYRSLLNVALRKDTALLGVIGIFRKESRPFGDKQIALLHNFAAQAVIAMENARLLTETREALERQTATAEVLGVINSSPGNLRPVFEAMLGQAIRLCEATFGHFRTYDGEGFPLAAVRGEPALVELHRQRFGHFVPGPHHPISRLVRGERLIHIPDTAADEAYRHDPTGRSLWRPAPVRCWPSRCARTMPCSATSMYIARWSDRLATSNRAAGKFRAQAVIAMENARLLTETREALEQQTATAEVLGVITVFQTAKLRRGVPDVPRDQANCREPPDYHDFTTSSVFKAPDQLPRYSRQMPLQTNCATFKRPTRAWPPSSSNA